MPAPLQTRIGRIGRWWISLWLTVRNRVRTGANGRTPPHWCDQLREAAAALETMNQSSERDFLTLGAQLSDFLEGIRQLSHELDELIGMLTGDGASASCAMLEALLDTAEQLQARAATRTASLKDLRDSTVKIRRLFAAFGSDLTAFRVVGTLTRVETARLGQEGSDFGSLAEEVRALTGSIQAQVETAIATAESLTAGVQNALQAIGRSATAELVDLPAVVRNVRDSLSAFCDRRSMAGTASIAVSDESHSVSQAIEQLVASIQFHDITRQQIEHVIEAMRSLHAAGAASRHPSAETVDVLRMQISQIRNAQRTFDSSCASIEQKLQEMAARVDAMQQGAARLMNVDGGEASFFVGVEGSLENVLVIAQRCAAEEKAANQAFQGLESMLERIRQAVTALGPMELQMRRTALNGQIRAVHLGAPGDPLSTLAGVMLTLAAEIGGRWGQGEEILGRMASVADSLGDEPAAAQSGAESENTIAQQVRTSVDALHAASERSFARILSLNAMAEGFCERVIQVRQEFSPGTEFGAACGRAVQILERLVSEAGAQAGAAGPAYAQTELERLAQHYTMHAEREVHRAAVAGTDADPEDGAVLAAAGAARGSGSGDNDLGDNVELF